MGRSLCMVAAKSSATSAPCECSLVCGHSLRGSGGRVLVSRAARTASAHRTTRAKVEGERPTCRRESRSCDLCGCRGFLKIALVESAAFNDEGGPPSCPCPLSVSRGGDRTAQMTERGLTEHAIDCRVRAFESGWSAVNGRSRESECKYRAVGRGSS